jgi:beta-lactam-binding protein with PASTA domain
VWRAATIRAERWEREDLTRAGFTLRRVTYRSVGDAFPGTIVDQFPPAGDQIAAGGSVELVAATRD